MPNIFKNPATAAITGGVALPFGMDWLQHEDVKVPVVDSVLDMTRGKFDKFRAGNFALNSMIGAASGGLMAKPKTLVQGASLAALAPAKDLLLNMQGTPEKVNKVLDEMPEVTKAMKDAGNRSNILMGILGAGALGIGGAALWKYLKKRDDIPGENGTIQYIMKGKEGDPETDALVTVPINNPAVSQSVAEDMNISVRRGLGKAVKWNSSRRDPNTGRLIPYAVWNNLYGHKDESEPAKAPNSDYDAKSGDNDPNGMNKDAAKKKDKKEKKGRKGGLHSTAGMIGGSTVGALKSMALGGGLIPGALSGAHAGMEVDTLRNLNDSLKPKDKKNAGFISGGILGGLGGGALGALTAPENKAVSVPIGAILGALAGGSTGIDIDSYRASGAVADKISKKRKGKEHSNRFGTTLAGALTGAGLGGLVGSLKRDAMGNAGLGLGAGTGIGAGLGALSGGLLGSKIDEYRNITDANEMLGNGRSHKAPAIGAGAGGLLGAILGGIGAGPGGAVGGALAGAGGGALLGTGVGSYLKSNDIVDKEEEAEKNAAAEGFNAMAYNSGSGAPEGVLKAVGRFTRPADTESKDDHSYTEGSHNTHSAGLGLNDAGGNAGTNKDLLYASALRAGMAKRASREFAEGAGAVSSSLLGAGAGGAGGAAIASGLGKDPMVGGIAGAALGALVPGLAGYLTGKVAGPRPAGDQELHDGHADMAEYVVPGYATYQYARRMETEDASAKAKEDTMRSYLATGAMPGGQDGIPSNLESDDEEEDYGNFKSAAVQGAYPGQQPASSTHPALRNLNGALNNNRELANANRGFTNAVNNPAPVDPNKYRQNANTQNNGQQGQQAGQQMQSQRDYNEQTRIATDMQMYGYARVRGADGKLYHPQQQQGQQAGQQQQQTGQQQQQAGTSGIQVANTTLPAAGGANATSTQNPAPRTGNGNAPLTMNSTPAVVQDNGQRELQSVNSNGATAGEEYDRRLNMYRQHGYKGDGSDITGLGPRDKFIADYNKKREGAAPPPMTPEQKAADEAQRASTAATTRSQLRSDIARERTITNLNGTSQTIDSKTTPEQYLTDNMFNNGSSTSPATGLDSKGVYHAKARRINSAGLAETVDMDSDTVDTANLRKSLGDMRNGMQKKLGVDPNSMNFWNLNSRDDYDNAAKWMKEYGAGQDQIDALNRDRTARYGRDNVNSWYLGADGKTQANTSVGVRNMLSSYGDAGKQSWAKLRSPNDYYQARSWLLSNGASAGRGDVNIALKRLEADYNTRFGNQTEYNPQQGR